MPDDDEMRRYGTLERIDERTLALKEGMDRIREDIEDSKRDRTEMKTKMDSMWGNGNEGLIRIIDSRFDVKMEKRSMTARDWVNTGLTLLGVIIAGLAYMAAKAAGGG